MTNVTPRIVTCLMMPFVASIGGCGDAPSFNPLSKDPIAAGLEVFVDIKGYDGFEDARIGRSEYDLTLTGAHETPCKTKPPQALCIIADGLEAVSIRIKSNAWGNAAVARPVVASLTPWFNSQNGRVSVFTGASDYVGLSIRATDGSIADNSGVTFAVSGPVTIEQSGISDAKLTATGMGIATLNVPAYPLIPAVEIAVVDTTDFAAIGCDNKTIQVPHLITGSTSVSAYDHRGNRVVGYTPAITVDAVGPGVKASANGNTVTVESNHDILDESFVIVRMGAFTSKIPVHFCKDAYCQQ